MSPSRPMEKSRRAAVTATLGLLAGAVLAACPWGHCDPRGSSEQQGSIRPASHLPGGYGLVETRTYSVDNLYEIIDGEAERFIQFGFKSLLVAAYASDGKVLPEVEVQLYDMGRRRNAYGIFADSRWPGEAGITLGNQGYVYGSVAAFWKGRFYVRVSSFAERAAGREVLGAAQVVASWIRETSTELEEFSVFPRRGLDRKSLVYERMSAFGLPYKDTFSANYTGNGHAWKLFFSDMGSSQAAQAAFGEHVKFIAQNGTIRYQAQNLAWGREKYNRDTLLVVRGRWVAGCMGLEDREAAEAQVRQLLSRAVTLIPSQMDNVHEVR
jgi:hypothetical protein